MSKVDFPPLPRRSLFAPRELQGARSVTKPAPIVTKPRNETPPEVAAVTKPASTMSNEQIRAAAPTIAERPLGGRPPIGERAMTGAERVARHRANKKAGE
jgi:hypothetical protein